jgi:antirestriction protein ArdC
MPIVPINASTNARYKGGNVLVLWATAMLKKYESGTWATFRQWKELGAMVRKGEKATHCVKWHEVRDKKRVDSEGKPLKVLIPLGFAVFNSEQVDGWTPPEPYKGDATPIEHADAFFNRVGARVTLGSNRAYYSPGSDGIWVPALQQYDDPADYYSILAHEHVHWTGHRSRNAREGITEFDGFGSEKYAKEELIAELGAAFLCAYLGISNQPREDHAQYLASWLKVLKTDAKALFTAASGAQKGVDYMIALGDPPDVEEEQTEMDAELVGV